MADHELRDDLGIQGGPAARDATQGIHEVADIADAVLQQVPDAARPVREQLRRVLPLDVLAQHEDRVPGTRRRASMAARRPSSRWLGGIRTSTTETSGWCSMTASTNDGPSPTLATTVPPDSWISRAIPSRMSADSSAMTTRSGEPSSLDEGPASRVNGRRSAPGFEPAWRALAGRRPGSTGRTP